VEPRSWPIRAAANPENRCFSARRLYDKLAALAATEQWDAIADGTNLDDTSDIRPGMGAAQEHGVVSPLLEAGLRKADIRSLSQVAGLPTWDKPEMPCLSSRIPFGSPSTTPSCVRSAAEEGLRARSAGRPSVTTATWRASSCRRTGSRSWATRLPGPLGGGTARRRVPALDGRPRGYRRGGFHRSGTTDIVWRRPAPDATNAES
jgi:hypothetical protein